MTDPNRYKRHSRCCGIVAESLFAAEMNLGLAINKRVLIISVTKKKTGCLVNCSKGSIYMP